ncbi:trihelix transcription factor ASR3-like [Cucurbita maxima]|uniref:Trihelix transcription factor ASR3-like n=1 Tax=Cucurbita maxima TaxID=3661 RepID=A0A6J1KBG1_CUCMA|nr:trihelix transcription factor ASR3-like [Cucurbita maxima]
MSDPPTTSSEPPHQQQHHPHPTHHHHHPHHHQQQQQQQLLHLPLIHGGAARINTAAATSSSTVIVREYRKGNWTLQETMILITAKKLDDERRNKVTLAPPADPTARKGGELRWKWVENYCWSHGCHRSQNQCNDKWDNLLRDYKKVREYESRACDQQSQIPSYWKMEKHERKDNNLPSNMAFEVYQALNDVVQRKFSQRPVISHTTPTPLVALPPAPPPSSAIPALPPPPPTTATNSSPAVSESSSSGTESSEKKEKAEAKRRKMEDNIERSAAMLAQTLRSCEEQREIRHQEVMEVQKRCLQIEEARNHIHRQGISDMVAAIANLSAEIDDRERRRSEGYECSYNGEEVRMLKQQNEAMQAEVMNVKTELSQLRDQMPSLMQTMMHNMLHNIPPPPPPSMDPSGSGGDA